jgi:predicted lipoprotein with Yx(FWY)xxD motif
MRVIAWTTAAAIAAAAMLFTVPAGARVSAAKRQAVVKTMHNAALRKTILVNRRGLTLYHLSVERRGHFICKTSSCLSFWKPLVVRRGTIPTGARFLGTVKRPDRRLQVTYRGGPLYTFAQDRKPGDAKGDGFKDVGVWHPATTASAAPAASGSGGSGGGYPGY